MFYNISNHPLDTWSKDQLQAARTYDQNLADIPFPAVNSSGSKEDVAAMAQKIAENIEPGSIAMVQGEMTLTYALVSLLKEKGVLCLAACSERKTVETRNEDGSSRKTSLFAFTQFREY